ncbi:MAG: CCA tRNA nucleotidyltransferase, partial [Rhizobiales bacterium]|nr:CCA tRNA nucleotidyltransferase [Hyphomicrobiales bacterium]
MSRERNFAGAEWFATPAVLRLFAVLDQEGDEARIIGGAVRDALLGRRIGDLDFATTATPDIVVRRAGAAGIKTVPTGIEHGTVTLIVDGEGHQVTTLREDVETDGRRAVVRFGRDWAADARRRDFTVNALSVDSAGRVHDPLGGMADVDARRIRFIGEADQRIAEDRLRILRFFRLHAELEAGDLDTAGLGAAIRGRDGIRELSAERVAQEMRRLLVAPGAAPTVTAMQEGGILPVVLGGIGYVATFARLVEFEKAAGVAPAFAPRMTGLAARIGEDAERVAARLKLSNAERSRMVAAIAVAGELAAVPDERTARRLLYRVKEEAYRDGVALAAAWAGDGRWLAAWSLPERWPAPAFPLTGADVLAVAGGPGPAVGAVLRSLEAWWIGEDFRPDAAALRARLQQIVA